MGNKISDTVVIALAGKGGVGKTSLSAMIVRLLSEYYPDKKILAIDADPAIGLSTALDIEFSSTVDDIRKAFVRAAEIGEAGAVEEMMGEARSQMFDALVEKNNLSFLAIGRPEAAGCYCAVNAYLKEMIGIVAEHFDYVVIDGEAGIEQINRRVLERVSHLLLVSDASRKGLNVVSTIRDVAEDLVMCDHAGLIVNRIPAEAGGGFVCPDGLTLLAAIPDDHSMTLCDVRGDSIFTLSKDSEIYRGTKAALEAWELID